MIFASLDGFFFLNYFLQRYRAKGVAVATRI